MTMYRDPGRVAITVFSRKNRDTFYDNFQIHPLSCTQRSENKIIIFVTCVMAHESVICGLDQNFFRMCHENTNNTS